MVGQPLGDAQPGQDYPEEDNGSHNAPLNIVGARVGSKPERIDTRHTPERIGPRRTPERI